MLACRRRLAEPQHPRPRSRPPRNLSVGSSLGPASCAGGLRCSPRRTRLGTASGSFAKAHSRRNANARAPDENALRSPRHPLCQTRRGRGQARRARGRWHCAGPAFGLRRVHVPRRLVPSPVPRPASRAFLSQRLRAAVAQSDDMQSVLCFGPRPGIPSARSIHSAALRRVTYRGIVRSAAGAHSGRHQSAAREGTSPAPSRHLNGNSSGATAPINKAPRPRPAPSFLAPSFPPRSVRDCFVFRVPSPGAPRVLSLRSFTGELPPAAQPARWPRASSPRRCAGGSARTATRQPQRRLRRRALRLRRAGRATPAHRRASQRREYPE